MPKRKCNFTIELKQEFPHLKDTGKRKVLRNHCGSVFPIVHGGRADVNNHLGIGGHKSVNPLITKLTFSFTR